jgi:hypothetical protein
MPIGQETSSARWFAGLAVASLCVAIAPLGWAQSTPQAATTHGSKTVRAERTEAPVAVDGDLTEAAWQQVPAANSLTQKEPYEGQPSTEKTEIRVLYTATTLYIGILCADSDPAGILASERRRDGDLDGDDSVSILLDTFHDHRNAFLFRTNPLGTQYDALVTDEGRALSVNWDERWEVVTRRTEIGWTAEFAIPFKSIRVPESENGDGMVWGLEVQRVIRRKNEIALLNGYRRGFDLTSMSQAGHLTGLEEIETGLRLRIKPYILGGGAQSVRPTAPGSDDFRTVTTDASDVGIEVLKYRITPSLTSDLTWNTDFAQADVDDLQVNLDRFPLLFPEKREFFQEGAGIFSFGNGGAATSSMQLFHSRQIGLSPRRRPVPIAGGGRITGKLSGLTLGLMNVQTEALPSENIPASNYSVARVKRDVFARSTVGGFFLNREAAASGDFNRVYGMDAGFTFFKYFTVDGFFAKSDEPSEDGKWVAEANAGWNSDSFQLGMEYLSVDPDFRDDLGFVRRTDIRRLGPTVAIRRRPNIPHVRQVEISGSWDYLMSQDYRVLRRTDKYVFQIYFQDSGQLRIIPFDYEFDRVERPFVSGGVTVPAGDYQWNVYVLRYAFSPKRRFSGTLDFSHRYGFYKGNMHKFQLTPRLKVSEQFSIETNYEIYNASLPGGDFVQHVVNLGINYALNNQWLTSTTFQWDNIESFFGFHFRLNYIFRPGDDFFLIYTEGRQTGGPQEGEKDRSLRAKLTYSFDF